MKLSPAEKALRVLAYTVFVVALSAAFVPQEHRNRIFHPGFGSCGKCHLTWDVTAEHTTNFREGAGIFALCNKCWMDLDPHARLIFYWRLTLRNAEFNPKILEEWPDIEKAVLAGK